MKTQQQNFRDTKTNKALGLYTVFMVGLGIAYTITTFIKYVS